MNELIHAIIAHTVAIAVFSLLLFLFRGPLLALLSTVIAQASRGLVRRIDGDWEAVIEADGGRYLHHIHLRQLVSRVWGTMLCERSNRKFRIVGRINHHTVIAQFELIEGAEIAIDNGTFSMSLNDDGDKMVGQLICPKGTSIQNYLWRRADKRDCPGKRPADISRV